MEVLKLSESHVEEADISIDTQMNRKLNRKFDIHLIPWLFGIWLLAFIDRSNIGNAKIDGLTEDLGIAKGTGFNVALLVFFIPYILIDVPSNWVVKHIQAGFYLPALITGWGLVCTFLGFTESLAGLIICRLLLGLFEGGLLGGIVVYLAMFYKRHDMGLRIGLFYCAAPLSGAFGGLLATGLAKISVGKYSRWRWIFFVEGAITTVFGLICFFTMPHTPATSKFLTEEEREAAMRRLKEDSHGANTVENVNDEHFDWHWVKMALKAPQTYFSSFAWFSLLVSLYSFSLFLPTIIKGLGYTDTRAQLFTVPPYIAGFVTVLLTTAYSDKFRARGPIMAGGCLVAIAGYIILLAAKSNGARYAGTFLVAAGVYPGSALIMSLLSNNLAPHYVRATGLGVQIAFANCAAFIASFIYLAKDAPDYKLGHSISLAFLVVCFITVCLQIIYCKWENSRREGGHRDHLLEDVNQLDRLGHRHPAFRYTI